ncbi:TBC1D25 [Cordylochernes scorpioides]|uniref:TBC1D25 n=1 Tax=Cordylochernes scorpioides TaxID=51811 RepID=A0ABY6K0H5_9ARAC|nr:TBC1D25 [Cordylochernes scorpioides]
MYDFQRLNKEQAAICLCVSQMEKTISLVQKAFNLSDGDTVPIYPPLTDSKFHQYLDGNGEVIRPMEFRKTVFHGGIEPTLRKVVWKHLLNVYPCGLTAKERIAYMKQKGLEYQHLKSIWKDMLATGAVSDEVKYIVNMVRKDVLRTDRTHAFYAGPDDNANVVSLFNILITYALNHPSVSYCQGMSDLASPILVTMKDEAHAYVCFCALMHRLKPNFSTDGEAMTLKFQHLTELLEYYDPEFFEYLKERGADDILFCYRWLLLELKREFAFDDALHMLEVLWSSIPANPPQHGLPLWEVQFNPQTQHLHSRTNPFSKVRTLRKHNSFSAVSTNSHLPSDHKTLQRACKSEDISDIVESSINLSQGNDSTTSSSISLDAPMQPSTTGNIPTIPEDNVAYKQRAPYKLPPPNELGGGNPFMLYICLTILLQHRNTLLRSHMDYNEIAMYFDKLVRKHNVHQVLHQARTIFKEYLHSGDYDRSWLCDPRV